MKYLQMTKARGATMAGRPRQLRIPAFGEWNYAYVDCAAGDWPVTHYFESGMHHAGGGLVVAIPPNKPANKVVKWSSTPTVELEDEDEKQKQHVVAVAVGLGDHNGSGAVKKKQGKQQSPVVGHAYKQACPRAAAAKAMDQDLYHIPPDMLCHEPRKRLTRRSGLWMGCLGLNCVA